MPINFQTINFKFENIMAHSLITFLLIMSLQNSSSQTLDKYVDKIFFGIPSLNPDSTIAPFVQKYVPIVYKKYSPGSNWIAHPPPIAEPKYMTINNSYFFDKNPAFNVPFNKGYLAITQRIYEEKNYIDQISKYELCFEFEDEKKAKHAYKELIGTFSSFHVLERFTKRNGINKAEYTDKSSNLFYSKVQVLFAKDYFISTKYQYLTKEGYKTIIKTGYKIVVLIGNELY